VLRSLLCVRAGAGTEAAPVVQRRVATTLYLHFNHMVFGLTDAGGEPLSALFVAMLRHVHRPPDASVLLARWHIAVHNPWAA
jgi:hypothetical protein